MEKQAFEPTGLIPRSIIRTVDRFVQQLLPGREKIALQEYRVSRYQILVSIKSLLTLFLIPILVSSTMKALLFTPLVEHFWNKNQSEIFLNQYQEKRAFSEMRDFSEKMFFESLLIDNKNKSKLFESENFDSKTIANLKTNVFSTNPLADEYKANCVHLPHISKHELCKPSAFTFLPRLHRVSSLRENLLCKPSLRESLLCKPSLCESLLCKPSLCESLQSKPKQVAFATSFVVPHVVRQSDASASVFSANQSPSFYLADWSPQRCKRETNSQTLTGVSRYLSTRQFALVSKTNSRLHTQSDTLARQTKTNRIRDNRIRDELSGASLREARRSALYAIHQRSTEGEAPILLNNLTAKMHVLQAIDLRKCSDKNNASKDISKDDAPIDYLHRLQQVMHYLRTASPAASDPSGDAKEKLPKDIIKFVTDVENEKYQILFQKKSLELAKSYNKQSILAITNLLGDFFTFFTLFVLFRIMRPELIILKSFLTESVYSLSDTTKSFLLILGMDLLVGFHSPRGWELLLEGFLRHIGLPENENFILLFVALFPVFLDTVFKYWIFRYLNKISPSTVVTYHSMIE